MRRRTKIIGGILAALVLTAAVAVGALMLWMSHDSPCGAAPGVPAGAPSMRAIVHRCYGSPDVAKLEAIPRPPMALADHAVLVRVHAASVNPLDWHYLEGKPYVVRAAGLGMGAPKDVRLGTDFAGTVEAVGQRVTRFKPGDAVYGGADGSFAQYVTVREDRSIAPMPANLTFGQAAAVPIAGLTALEALRDQGKIRAGEKVLINGAGGGVGTFAVQIAKAYGADVTAVTSTANRSLVRSIGADHVIDYTHEDFTRGTQRYDLIVDCGGGHSLLAYRRVLTPRGTYVLVGASDMGQWLDPLEDFIEPAVLSHFTSQRFVAFISDLSQAHLMTLRDLIQSGKVEPVIDRRYPLAETAAALRYAETQHARGKVVIDVE